MKFQTYQLHNTKKKTLCQTTAKMPSFKPLGHITIRPQNEANPRIVCNHILLTSVKGIIRDQRSYEHFNSTFMNKYLMSEFWVSLTVNWLQNFHVHIICYNFQRALAHRLSLQ